jgi:hypothetical protein
MKNFPQPLGVKITDDPPVVSDRDGTPFLRDHHGDSITFFSHPNPSSVPQAKLTISEKGSREWKYTGGSKHLSFADDHRPIVQRCIGIEDREEQLVGHLRV